MAEGHVIALDAMGGDAAPAMVLMGADLALVRHPAVKFLIFGDKARIDPILDGLPRLKIASTLIHTDDVVGNDDKPAQTLRHGRQSSMWLAIDAVRQGNASAVVSAGNTGALMAMARYQLRMLEGIARPALASIWPNAKGESVVLDLGANVECDAKDLFDFAVMGAAFARITMGLARPAVGLLNVGTEDMKGSTALKEAAAQLRVAPLPLEFIGFVEGSDISLGKADVIVTDGFTGNVALKTAEGTAKLILGLLREAMSASILSKLGYLLARGAFKILQGRLDPRAHNGGVFLGLSGLAVKSHGGTDALGFASAIDVAVDLAMGDLIARVRQDLAQVAANAPAISSDAQSQPTQAADAVAPDQDPAVVS
jgi:glycerol-3-phosphate acyltransferase PlsX